MRGAAEPLPGDVVQALRDAGARVAAADIRYFTDVDSTNDVALALAEAGAADGTTVLAEQQLRGRGRRGTTWFSPPGAGLYMSRVVRLSVPASGLSLVTLGSGVAVARAVREATGLPLELKWPNDLVMGRPWRKLGGVLSEAVGNGSRVDAVVVGVGLNLRSAAYPPDIGHLATSIESELGRAVDRAPVVVRVLTELADVIRALDEGNHAWICREWRRLGAGGLGGAVVRWRDPQGERSGLARDIDDDGALVVEREGRLERLIGGEVTWERLSHVES
jgi:BirA family biotin operon repressor/biotin-[acetyl-CoA-carboxylase] ligase